MYTRQYIYLILHVVSFIGVLPLMLYGQSKSFEERYEEVYYSIIASDVNEAIRIADSLISVSKNDLQKIKAMMLAANIHHSLGDISTALDHVLEAQNIANKGRYTEFQARTSGFLASTFRNVGLLEESKKHLMQANTANERQKDSPGYYLTKANISQENAFRAIHDSAFHKALDYLKEAAGYMLKDVANNAQVTLVMATNDQLKATCYINIGELDLADSLLNSSIEKLQGAESSLRSYIYRSKAELAMARAQYDTAYHYLQLAKPYIESSKREELKELLYSTFSKYYQAIGNNEEAVYYYEMYRKVIFEKERTARQISNALIRRLNEENQRYYSNALKGWWYFSGIITVMFSVLIFLYFKRRKEKKAYIILINLLKGKNETAILEEKKKQQEIASNMDDHSPKDEPKLLISDDTERRLIHELELLETQHFYLNKELSLSSLANQLNTNQRYVSYAIRKYKEMDFHTYIQHRRIHYITKRLKNEPELLDYKLSYLAEISGFSSHSKFSAVFKSVTGISPSTFVQYTKEGKNKNQNQD